LLELTTAPIGIDEALGERIETGNDVGESGGDERGDENGQKESG
jgi:hypothetical protein